MNFGQLLCKKLLLKKNIPNETNENSAKRLSKKTPREGSDAKE
tara:strand:+ start:462 stop:590 length:129 start_codon:yes stop_codon:yes gene_type:complete